MLSRGMERHLPSKGLGNITFPQPAECLKQNKQKPRVCGWLPALTTACSWVEGSEKALRGAHLRVGALGSRVQGCTRLC